MSQKLRVFCFTSFFIIMFGQTQRVLYINFYVAVLYCRCKKYRRQLIVLFIIMVAFWEVYQKAILPMAGVKPEESRDALHSFSTNSKICKILWKGCFDGRGKSDSKVLDYDTIGKNYDPDLSDPVKNTYKQKDEYLQDYFKIWFEMLKKHPTVYIQATLNGTYGYWGYMTEIRYPYGYYVQPESMDAYQKNIKYIIQKNKIYQRYISWGFRYNISENSIDIIYKTDDVFMDFDWIAWHGMFF